MKGEGTVAPVSPTDVAEEIRAWRERTGLTHVDLADEVGVSLATIVRLAKGDPTSVAGWAVVRVRRVVAS